MQLSVVIPVFNAAAEVAERVGALLTYLDGTGLVYEVLAVDDGSADDSAALLEGLGHERLAVLRLACNRGKFGAIKAGMTKVQGRCRLFTDADIPYELPIIPYLVDLVDRRGFHLAIGDRTLPGSRYRDELGPIRGLATRAFTLFVRLLVTGGLCDTQCGIKALRGDVADALFPVLQEDGFAGDVELLYVALSHNLEIRRVPARLAYQGQSSVHAVRDGLRMLRSLLALRRRRRAGAYASEALTALAEQRYWE